MMSRLLSVCAGLLIAGSAAAQIMECVDAKGRREYAQVCAPGTVRQNQVSKGASRSPASATTPAAAPAKSTAELEADFRKRNLERQEAEAKAAKDQASAEEARRNCESARSNLRSLTDGLRISQVDPKTGERTFLADEDRPARIAAAQKSVDAWCNNKK